MQKSIDSSGNIDQKSRGNQNKKRSHSMNRGLASTGQHSKANLDDIHHGQHQKQATHDRSNGGSQHPQSQHLQIDVCPKRLIHILTIQKINGKLQTLRHKRREQKKAKRHDLENQKLPSNINASIADRGILETMLPRRGQRKPYKYSDGEK